MEPLDPTLLVRISRRRFRNFSDAADAILDALGESLPGALVLARLDPDERAYRVLDLRGDALPGIEPGAPLPGADPELDPASLSVDGAHSMLAAPLEMSDGRIAGILCALSAQAGAYDAAQTALLGTAARLLGYEWESVELRSELRRLRVRINAGPQTDADTGLANREAFLDLLDREWRLAQRGTVESVLVAFKVSTDASANGDGAQARRLALKLTAEVLEGSTRETDRIGRIGDNMLAAVLVGCPLEDAPAFIARFLGAVGRVTEGERRRIDVSCGVQPLAASPSAEQGLSAAEAAADPGADAADAAAVTAGATAEAGGSQDLSRREGPE